MVKNLINKIAILYNGIIGYGIKLILSYSKLSFRGGLNTTDREKKIVISLTSYGYRVESVVIFTLISLLRQTVKPDFIILWLDNSWNYDNLPKKLIKIQQMGVLIKFCQDLRSYKKLLPTLSMFPNDIIITVDDDMYYSKNLVKKLYRNYLSDPTKVHCAVAHEPTFDENAKLKPYRSWNLNINNVPKSGLIFPVGVGGILYPPYCFHRDILNIELLTLLCPIADDIWFWVMEYLNGTKQNIVISKHNYNLDLFYQYFHANTSLNQLNLKENFNDVQLKAVCEYYNLKFK